MAGSQIAYFPVAHGTVTRTHYKTTSDKDGCGGSKRLYVGRIGSYNYRSWLRFTLNWAGVGNIVKATLVVYTDDFLGLNQSESKETPAFRIRYLKGAFSVGNNADGVFNSSDYKPGSLATTPEVASNVTKEANGINRIDITTIVKAWAPKAIGGKAMANNGIGLIERTSTRDRNDWSGWSENATDAALRPFIEVVYEYGATVPDAPTGLSPSGTVASIPAFEGDFSDKRAADTLSRSHVQVYSPSAACTVSTNDMLTSTAHGLVNGDVIYLSALTGGAPLALFTPYYVRQRTDNTFKLATTNSDTTIRNVTASGTGGAWRTLVYDKTLPESNAAILAARFNHIPENMTLTRNVTYAWRARVYDQEGQVSPWTSLLNVAVTNTNPDPPVPTPDAETFSTLDGVQFRGGPFTDPDVGDRLVAYQIQMSAYPEGDAHWDDGESLTWDTGKRLVGYGSTSWQTPYGGNSLAAGTYHWRSRQWDGYDGLSTWAYASLVLSADFVSEPNESVASIQMRPRAPWRILVKEMAYNPVGGTITGNASTNVLTSSTVHGLLVGRHVRFSTLNGGTGLYAGKTYHVKTVPTTSTFTLSETPGGSTIDFSTNVTASALTAVTTRGPGRVVAVIEDAYNVGASVLYNSPGEMHFTLGISHPQVSVIEPRQTHYAVEFRQGDGWREVYAGLIVDFDASDTDIVFYGIDYLGLLDSTVDEHYDPSNIEKSSDSGGSKYVNKTLSAVITDQLARAREPANSIVGFISTGSVASMAEMVTVYSTYQSTLPFVASLIDSHRSGTGKRTRLWCRKTSVGGYEWVVTDDPGVVRDNLRLRYGELVQGYRVVPFGKEWATRVSAIGRDKAGVRVLYQSATATGIDEYVWGRWMKPIFIDGVADANDMVRRTKQSVASASKLGKGIALGLRSGVIQPRDGYDLLDQFPVDIEHGSVSTSAFGSGYWVAVGITWQALQRGDLNTTLTLHPREDSTPPDDDLLVSQPISPQHEWQVGWEAPDPNPTIIISLDTGYFMDAGLLMDEEERDHDRYYYDLSTGRVYVRDANGEWVLATAPSTPARPSEVFIQSRATLNADGTAVANLSVEIT